jgi:nitroimidazol reductase NimA-like FMN-containing flavoprotein (pyridoxamine 5'-phosphate oxidase superfamily)
MPETRGAWDEAQARRFLETARIPVRLAVARPGRAPLLLSLWYAWHEGALWCATRRGAAVVKALEADPHCAFEVAPDDPPYRGVRGAGRAGLEPARGAEILDRLLDRYRVDRRSDFAAWLWSRREDEVAIRIAPERLVTWDFAPRMGDAVPPPPRP